MNLTLLVDTSSSVLSFLDVIEANIAEQQHMGSESTLPTGSVSSVSSIPGSKRVRLAKTRRISHAQVTQELGHQVLCTLSEKSLDLTRNAVLYSSMFIGTEFFHKTWFYRIEVFKNIRHISFCLKIIKLLYTLLSALLKKIKKPIWNAIFCSHLYYGKMKVCQLLQALRLCHTNTILSTMDFTVANIILALHHHKIVA